MTDQGEPPPPAGSSRRALVLAPAGRDAFIAARILEEAGIAAEACADLPGLCRELAAGAATAVVVEEALTNADLAPLARWIAEQPPWSDFAFVLLARRGAGLERNPAASRLAEALGNVSFLERPFHPLTLVSAVRTAIRGRLRQYEARERMEEIRRAEALLERRVEERTAELVAANRQLAEQIAEREKVEAALRQSQRLEAVGQFTSGVAHDFNNLLMVVLGNVRHLLKRAESPDEIRRLSMMREAGERGARLTQQLLAFSRRQKLEPRPVDLNETVASMRDLLQSTIGGSVRIETGFEPALWPAMIDPTQIELVILNLAINARDAMEVGGTLRVETANVRPAGEPGGPDALPAGDYVQLTVSDTGPGMPPDILAKVFEPFFTTKAPGKGSGLGLSQVYGVAKQSGGGVRIETAPGEGTAVRVLLPRAPAAEQAERAAPSGEAGWRRTGAVILVVDDDHAVREVTSGMLRELGYHVREAGSGGAALEHLERHGDIDAVLLDFAMPGMNGVELERAIRIRQPVMPVLFATGYADLEQLEAGEDRIVRKPFMPDELARKLDAVLCRAPKAAMRK